MAFLLDEGGGLLLDEGDPPAPPAPPATPQNPGVLLEAAGLEPVSIDRYNGYIIRRLDLGDAETRAVVDNAPDADGTDDTTMFTGARVVGLQVRLVPRHGFVPAVLERRLRAFTAPRLRPVMTVTREGLPVQRITLRRGPFNAPIEQATFQDLTVQWVAPLGILESAEEHTQVVYAAGSGPVAGFTFPITFPLVFPASPPLGTGSVVNAGSVDAYPLIRIYGPVTEPVLDNVTQGKSLAFVGLTLLAGEFVVIDMRAKTILFNGDITDSRYGTLSFATSSWWTLSPGTNVLRFHPATYDVGVSLAEMVWRDSWA